MNFAYLKNFMDTMADKRTPGNAIQIYYKGNKVYQYAAGYADLERQIPLSGEEYFNIYSCSKIATVTAALQLLEQGKFLLSDPLYEYIPEYRTMYVKLPSGELKKAKNFITIGQLFQMTAGFNYNTNAPAFAKARAITAGKMDTVTVIKSLAQEPLSFEPGTHWQYSLCHDVLAGLVSVIAGKPFREYMKESIFVPLEMKDCVYHHTKAIISRMASMYTYMGEQKFLKKMEKSISHVFGEEYDSGGAGITTTLTDYMKLIAALANFGLGLNGERILSKGAVELMRTNCLNAEQMKDFNWSQYRGYGYGLGVRTMIDKARSGSLGSVGEFGWCGAAGSMVLIDPEQELAVFYVQHCLNPREEYYMPRLRNVIYACLNEGGRS